jgi:hypothetical protein
MFPGNYNPIATAKKYIPRDSIGSNDDRNHRFMHAENAFDNYLFMHWKHYDEPRCSREAERVSDCQSLVSNENSIASLMQLCWISLSFWNERLPYEHLFKCV